MENREIVSVSREASSVLILKKVGCICTDAYEDGESTTVHGYVYAQGRVNDRAQVVELFRALFGRHLQSDDLLRRKDS